MTAEFRPGATGSGSARPEYRQARQIYEPISVLGAALAAGALTLASLRAAAGRLAGAWAVGRLARVSGAVFLSCLGRGPANQDRVSWTLGEVSTGIPYFEVGGLLEWWPVKEIEDLLVKLVVQVEVG